MEKKIRQEILGDKADEIREEIWQKERYAERESINLVKNEKIKEIMNNFPFIKTNKEKSKIDLKFGDLEIKVTMNSENK